MGSSLLESLGSSVDLGIVAPESSPKSHTWFTVIIALQHGHSTVSVIVSGVGTSVGAILIIESHSSGMIGDVAR